MLVGSSPLLGSRAISVELQLELDAAALAAQRVRPLRIRQEQPHLVVSIGAFVEPAHSRGPVSVVC